MDSLERIVAQTIFDKIWELGFFFKDLFGVSRKCKIFAVFFIVNISMKNIYFKSSAFLSNGVCLSFCTFLRFYDQFEIGRVRISIRFKHCNEIPAMTKCKLISIIRGQRVIWNWIYCGWIILSIFLYWDSLVDEAQFQNYDK